MQNMSHFRPIRQLFTNLINNVQHQKHIEFAGNFNKRFISYSTPNHMRFVQYRTKNSKILRLGAQISTDSDIIELSAVDASLPSNMVEFLQGGHGHMERAKRIYAEGKSVMSLHEVDILPPLTNPDKILCVGLNYKSHCDEQNRPYPEEPIFFNKFPSTIIGPTDKIEYPELTKALDYEIELGIVIGKKCRNISEMDIQNYIFGYTVAQDISARDWQSPKKNGGQWLFAKSLDKFCPIGPAIVAKEFVGDPNKLQLRCWINGEIKQDENTSDMVHNVEKIVSYLSHAITLLPGDLILSGTPAGVGIFSKPKLLLKPGDVINSEIQGIGCLSNTITDK